MDKKIIDNSLKYANIMLDEAEQELRKIGETHLADILDAIYWIIAEKRKTYNE